jgi:ATP-dependent Lon protease
MVQKGRVGDDGGKGVEGSRLKSDKGEKSVANTKTSGSDLIPVSEILPPNLILLPISQTTLFPGMMVPVILPEGKLTRTVEYVMEGPGHVGVVLLKHSDDNEANVGTGPSTSMTGLPAEGTVPAGAPQKIEGTPQETKGSDFYRFGVAAKIVKKINLPDNQISVLLTGLQRFELLSLVSNEPHYVANVKYLYEQVSADVELEALLRSALGAFKQISKDNPLISEEMRVALVNIDGPGKLADFMASVLIRDVFDYQKLVSMPDVKDRLQHLLLLLKKETDVQTMQRRIQDEINQKVSSAQREFYLQEQLKLIQKELGRHADEKTRLVSKFKERLKDKKLSAEAIERIDEETERLNTLPEQSSEYSVSINYLDWVTGLPWGLSSKESYDLQQSKKILDTDHYGLKDVKNRILEFLAVRKLKKTHEGTILCLVGPPGTGKTSLGKSIANALNRKFFRFSVGGMRDEAEIKGHRRTYVGAMPGKVIQGLKRVGALNPVFLIDEVDKIGSVMISGGDPSSALLEVLDPEQNAEFLDHYVDIPFDCSKVFFITTANTLDTIPAPLLDRMEVIHLAGYTDLEKFHIARRHLIPKQLEKNGLKSQQLIIEDTALEEIIARYAREAGVRNLEKQISKICRKVALRLALGKTRQVCIATKAHVEKYLGIAPYSPETDIQKQSPGVATGLAWTQSGGEVLYVESRAVAGRGGMKLTGSLGEVMQESANIAYTYVRGMAEKMGLEPKYFEKNLLHVHVPSGATPKDGPSAGVTMVASLYSLLTGKPIRHHVAMTGEITLTGKVLPVGGIKEKILAAKRAGIKAVLLPRANEKDLKELEREVKEGIDFIKVSSLDQSLKALF